jgi:enoyl-CoA hydratase
LAEAVLAGSPFSQKRIKALVYEGLAGEIDAHMRRHHQALNECFASDDHREGVASFLERRPAEFTGR